MGYYVLIFPSIETLSTAYAAEICPLAMRGYLTAFVNMCWGFGLLLSAGVVRASLELDSQWGWRIPFMIQWVWPVPLFVIACFAPESECIATPGSIRSLTGFMELQVLGTLSKSAAKTTPERLLSDLHHLNTSPISSLINKSPS